MTYYNTTRNGIELFVENNILYAPSNGVYVECDEQGEPILDILEVDNYNRPVSWIDSGDNVYIEDNRGNLMLEASAGAGYQHAAVEQPSRGRPVQPSRASKATSQTKYADIKSKPNATPAPRKRAARAQPEVETPAPRKRARMVEPEVEVRRPAPVKEKSNNVFNLSDYTPSTGSALIPLTDDRYTSVDININHDTKSYKFEENTNESN